MGRVLRIRELREGAGLAQQELAQKMSVLPSCVSNWESEVSLPRTRQLPQLAEVLGCSISELFEDPGETGPVSA